MKYIYISIFVFTYRPLSKLNKNHVTVKFTSNYKEEIMSVDEVLQLCNYVFKVYTENLYNVLLIYFICFSGSKYEFLIA